MNSISNAIALAALAFLDMLSRRIVPDLRVTIRNNFTVVSFAWVRHLDTGVVYRLPDPGHRLRSQWGCLVVAVVDQSCRSLRRRSWIGSNEYLNG